MASARPARWRVPIGHRLVARLAGVVAGAKALVLLVAGAALAQASTTSTTLPRPSSAGRRVNLLFVAVAVGGAVLIVLLQRRASRRLGDMFPTDPDDGAGKDGRQGP